MHNRRVGRDIFTVEVSDPLFPMFGIGQLLISLVGKEYPIIFMAV